MQLFCHYSYHRIQGRSTHRYAWVWSDLSSTVALPRLLAPPPPQRYWTPFLHTHSVSGNQHFYTPVHANLTYPWLWYHLRWWAPRANHPCLNYHLSQAIKGQRGHAASLGLGGPLRRIPPRFAHRTRFHRSDRLHDPLRRVPFLRIVKKSIKNLLVRESIQLLFFYWSRYPLFDHLNMWNCNFYFGSINTLNNIVELDFFVHFLIIDWLFAFFIAM